jgi:hypothetical protein
VLGFLCGLKAWRKYLGCAGLWNSVDTTLVGMGECSGLCWSDRSVLFSNTLLS